MEDTNHVHALDYVSVVRRRKWWLAAPIAGSLVIGLALVKWLPKEYRSAATLGVTAPMVSPSFLNQANGLDNQERLRAISQQMLSTPLLQRVALEEGLAKGAASDGQIAALRKAIEVSVPDPMANVGENRRLDTFVVAYSDSLPTRAQRVANRLATVFVDANTETRAARAEDTSAFIATQLSASQTRLGDLEERLRRAKEGHMGRLPEQTPANLQTLIGLRQQLEANATALHSEQDRLSMIERQLEGLVQGNSQMLILARGNEAAQPPETRVMTLERELAAARATYTDKHPEIQHLQEQLAMARREASADKGRSDSDRMAQLQLDPAYRQLSADRETTRLRIRELQRAGGDTQRQIGLYQSRVEGAPMVEQQLSTLQRDYELERQQYGELTSKLHAATIAENVERTRGGEEFTILYPATLPIEPIKPAPMRVLLVSLLAGVCVGVALTLGREYLDRSVHDIRALKSEFHVPVLGEVTRIGTV
jgi:polysaccharide chain length determinant protein (PEP-CTERM system associated)